MRVPPLKHQQSACGLLLSSQCAARFPWLSTRGSRVLAASLFIVFAACRSSRSRSDRVTADTGVSVAAPAATLPFPHRPAGCDYVVRSVSPSHPRVSPHADHYGPAPRVRDLHITFVGDPGTSVVIQWSTDDATLASEVRFDNGDGTPERIAQGYSFTYGGSGPRREHEVHLCGLEPGRRYRYRAGGDRAMSPMYSFVTAPTDDSPIRILVLGDARSDLAAWRAVARRANEDHADLMLFTGDAVNDGASQFEWDAFFDAGADLLASTPGLWADGNHEGLSEVYYALFAFPDNGDPHRHEHWFAASYGPLDVLVLNDTTVPPSEQRTVERDWIRATLGARDRNAHPWLVTMHHQPMVTDSIGHIPDATTRAAWLPLWDEFHVNVDLAGHVHNYESSRPLRGGSEITDDAHGTRFITYGGAGAPLYRFHAQQPWVQARESTHGYGILTVTRATMRWEARRLDGTVIEEFVIAR